MTQRRPWWLSFLDRVSFVVIALTALAILYTRSAGVAYFAAGATSCSLSVKLIKTVIAQPRPSLLKVKYPKKSYGMPSTHSAANTFFGVYIPLASLYLPIHHTLPSWPVIRVLPSIFFVPWTCVVISSRVWLGHHTWPQVLVGFAYGLCFALLWFKLWVGGWDEYGNQLETLVNGLISQWV